MRTQYAAVSPVLVSLPSVSPLTRQLCIWGCLGSFGPSASGCTVHPNQIQCRQPVFHCVGIASFHQGLWALVFVPSLCAIGRTSLCHCFPSTTAPFGCCFWCCDVLEDRIPVYCICIGTVRTTCGMSQPGYIWMVSPSPPCMAARLSEMAPVIRLGSMPKRWMSSMLRNLPHH